MIDIETSTDRPDIVATFTVDAPAARVWQVWTTPDEIRRWWPCDGMEMTVCDNDLRVGGAYRHVGRLNGQEHAFRGVYREVEPGQRLVHTEVYEAFPNDEAVITVEMTEQGGRTRVIDRTVFSSPEVCQAAVNHGAAEGIRESLGRLARLASATLSP